jgi:hypothetical protein
MKDVPHDQQPLAAELQVLALSDGEANALLARIRKRSVPPEAPAGLLGLSARRTRQLTLCAAAVALADVALIAGLSDIGRREPLELALDATLVERRLLTARDVYVLHLWGKP